MNTVFFFFFQAEDGIRDLTVTGVQTCALPISAGLILVGVAVPGQAEPGRALRPDNGAELAGGEHSARATRCRRLAGQLVELNSAEVSEGDAMAMMIYQRDALQQRRPGHHTPPTPGPGPRFRAP